METKLTDIATKFANELNFAFELSPTAAKFGKMVHNISGVIRPAVEAGWNPTADEISVLVDGEEDDMNALLAAIPCEGGASLKVILDAYSGVC